MKQKFMLLQLHKCLPEGDKGVIYPCIQDLIENGLDTSRFSETEQRPNRQDVTQYVAAWCRSTGMGEEKCRDWLIQYCTTMLSSISHSSLAAIRHSTKSNLKYIYRSEVPFLCEVHENRFKVACSKTCPRYAEMSVRLEEEKNRRMKALEALKANTAPEPTPEPGPSPKEIRKKAFEKTLAFIQLQLNKGLLQRQIVRLLNDNGHKTRAGKDWTMSILSNEISRMTIREPSEDSLY